MRQREHWWLLWRVWNRWRREKFSENVSYLDLGYSYMAIHLSKFIKLLKKKRTKIPIYVMLLDYINLELSTFWINKTFYHYKWPLYFWQCFTLVSMATSFVLILAYSSMSSVLLLSTFPFPYILGLSLVNNM